MLDSTTYRRFLAGDVSTLLSACSDLDVAVPSCPDWTLGDLVRHTGRIHRWADDCLRAGGVDRVRRPRGPGPEVDPRLWLQDAASEALDTLEAVDLTVPVHTWAGPRPGSWWLRRLAHETAVHRWDAQASIGAADDLSTSLAVDGVDEYLTEYVGSFAEVTEVGPVAASLRLIATDSDGRWHVTFGPDGVVLDHRDGPADVTVRAEASDLVLLLWKRRGLDVLEVAGDTDVFDRWQRVVNV